MTQKHTVICHEPVQGHKVLAESMWPWVKSMTMAGHKVVVEAREYEDDKTLKQQRFYWGPVLREIAEKAVVGGERYTAEAWHELFKRQFLGYRIRKVKVAGAKRTRVIRELRSTRGLGIRTMSKYLDQVQAFAASDLGVEFSVRLEDWQG